MADEERGNTRWERAEKETDRGLAIVWGLLPVMAVLEIAAIVLYFYFPAVWVTVAIVALAFVMGALILALGLGKTRRRG